MIGVFDSGVGGLSVFKEMYNIMPDEGYVYVSDNAFAPYGKKPVEYIIERAVKITDFLLKHNVDIVVVACNTATAAAISFLRDKYDIPFVAMEPAIKPAANESVSGVVGVLATENTFKGELYHNTLERFASNVTVIEQVGHGLVELVENGLEDTPQADKLLKVYITPMMESGADKIVLGCTHYPFLIDSIKRVAGDKIDIINPAPAVANQVKRVLSNLKERGDKKELTFYSTGDSENLKKIVEKIVPGKYIFFKEITI